MARARATVSLSAAYAAAADPGPKSVAKLCDFWSREGGSLPLDDRGNTILHVLAMHGNTVALKQLDDRKLILPGQDLWKANRRGDTPIHEAIRFGKDKFVEKMLQLDGNLVSARNLEGETPLYVAAKRGNEKAFNLLKSKSCSDRELVRADGRTVLHAAVYEECYGLPPVIGYERFDSTAEEQSRNQLPTTSKPSLRLKLITAFRRFASVFPWLRTCYEAKERHIRAMQLVQWLLHLEGDWSDSTGQRNLLIEAAKNGIIELVKAILAKFPFAAYTLDGDGKNIVHIAVERKDSVLFDYLISIREHKNMLADIDKYGNTVLHLATNVGSGTGMLLNQMTWDVCWFQRIANNSLLHFMQYRNEAGKTPEEMFNENHSTLQGSAVQAMKDMTNGLMLVSALIGTVNFAALFTLPGGYGQDRSVPETYGRPVLLGKEETRSDLIHLMWSLLVSLISFMLSMSNMLLIQLSRFRSSDFIFYLPLRFFIAITGLFISTFFTFLASLQAFTLNELSSMNKNLLMWLWLSITVLSYLNTVSITVIYMYYALKHLIAYKGLEILDLVG